MNRRRSISSRSVLLICVGLGAALAIGGSWGETLFDQQPPARLPTSSIKAVTVLGIETLGFFDATPIVRAIDGGLYEYDLFQGRYVPQESLPEYLHDTACQQKYVSQIEEAAGKVASCREVQPPGEWCPAPYTVFANTLAGDLWVFRQQQQCVFNTIMRIVVFVPAGLVVGVIIVVVMKTIPRNTSRS